ncbi:MAG: hypothetical protein Q7R72_00680 [bacterium]|nr:hypothetical protein [bacterium]
MKIKRYWLRGGLIGLISTVIITWIIPQFVCSDFYRIGPAYPTDQPICYSLIVNGRWIEIAIGAIVLGLLIGWVYGRLDHTTS